MMKILVDTNVIINYLTRREDKYRESSIQVMEMCADEKVEGYIAFHSLSIIWYFSVRACAVSKDFLDCCSISAARATISLLMFIV